MTAVDKTVAILSTVHGFVSDDTQCETLREHLRAVCLIRDVAFTIHEIAMRAMSSAVPHVDKELRVRTVTEDTQLTHLSTIRVWNPGKLPSVAETREVNDTQASLNAESWLTQIGFNFCFEFYKEGFRYAVLLEGVPPQRPLFAHIFVYKLKKLTERGNFMNMVDMSPGYLVELQCEEDPQAKDSFGVRLQNFAKSLSPHLFLSELPSR